MRTNFASAPAQTTATAVVAAVPAYAATTMSYGMWFTKAVKHANKRFTRPPCEVSH